MQRRRRSRRLQTAAAVAAAAKLLESSATPSTSRLASFATTATATFRSVVAGSSPTTRKARRPVQFSGVLDVEDDEAAAPSKAAALAPRDAGLRGSRRAAVSFRAHIASPACEVRAKADSSLRYSSSSSLTSSSSSSVPQKPLRLAPSSSCPSFARKRRRILSPAMPPAMTAARLPPVRGQLGPAPNASQAIRMAPVTRQQQQQQQQQQQHLTQEREQISPSDSRWPQNQRPRMDEPDKMDLIKSASRVHPWSWNDQDKSEECLVSKDNLEVCFHPQTSASAAAIRAAKPLVKNGNYYYWEVTTFDKTYGTSVMFGLCTKQQQLHSDNYCNLIGLDKNGWSLSHKGLIWHDGKVVQYTQMFPTDQTVTVGLLFDTRRGELSFFMDGKNLGVAFRGLNDVKEQLYPVIGSTAKCTRMRLVGSYCGFVSLLERSCFAVLSNSPDKKKLLKRMLQYQLPRNLREYLAEAAGVCSSQTKITAQLDPYNWNDC